MKKVLILSFECLYIHISVKKITNKVGWWDLGCRFVPDVRILIQRQGTCVHDSLYRSGMYVVLLLSWPCYTTFQLLWAKYT